MAEKEPKKKPKKPKTASAKKTKTKAGPNSEPESAQVNLRLPIMLHKRVRLFSLIEGKSLRESLTELLETGLNAWDDHHHEPRQCPGREAADPADG